MHNRPYTDYLWLCKLEDASGNHLGNTYRSTKAAKAFTQAIARVEQRHIVEKIKGCKCWSVICDGSTDSSVREQEMFYLRTALKGKITVSFIGTVGVEKANAARIVSAMESVVVQQLEMDFEEFLQGLCSLGCDGASVMTGKKGGVYGLLKEQQQCIVPVHCFAHRLELAFKDAVKKLKLYEKSVDTLAMGLYYFYHRSSLNRSMLRRSFEALNMEVLIPTRVGGTRWIGHLNRALSNITRSYSALIQHLQQVYNM